jgi:nitrite reductase/ring-hydroxylating ferredoxin subunit
MSEFVKVAALKDLPPGESKVVDCFGESVALFNVDGKLYAISDACPHAGGPLSEGYVSGTSVMCPWHGWTFDLSPNGTPPNDGIVRYTVKVENDDIFIQAPE